MKKLMVVALVAVGAAVGLRRAKALPQGSEPDVWSQATDRVPR